MNAVGEALDRKDRPAYVKFERLAVEDKAASLAAGHYVARDVDYANITPPYSKDVFKIKVKQWFDDLEMQVRNDRIPRAWVDTYKKAYQAFQNGQEAPLNGTAIKGWGVISPAQQETLVRLNVLTVEDLAAVNDEGLKRIGMGAMDLKNKAIGWLSQLNDKGPLTQEIAALKAENSQLNSTIATLVRQVEELRAMVKSTPVLDNVEPLTQNITAAAILDDEPLDRDALVQKHIEKFGKPPHHMAKAETIAKALES